jgi:hypothetical protein
MMSGNSQGLPLIYFYAISLPLALAKCIAVGFSQRLTENNSIKA